MSSNYDFVWPLCIPSTGTLRKFKVVTSGGIGPTYKALLPACSSAIRKTKVSIDTTI